MKVNPNVVREIIYAAVEFDGVKYLLYFWISARIRYYSSIYRAISVLFN